MSWWSGLLVLLTILNFVAYLLGLPLTYALTATVFFAAAPSLMAFADGLRRTPKNDDVRAAFAGTIILLIGSAISFLGVQSEGLHWSTIIDLIVLIVAAVLDIIGGAILANIGSTALSAQVYLILIIFAVAVVFGSKSLMYATMILSTLLWVALLPGAFGQSGKIAAAYVISWLGMFVSMIWSFTVIAVNRAEKDSFVDEEGGQK